MNHNYNPSMAAPGRKPKPQWPPQKHSNLPAPIPFANGSEKKKKRRKKKKVIKRVKMNMPPPFAHSASNKPKNPALPWWQGKDIVKTESVRIPKNLRQQPNQVLPEPQNAEFEFDVAIYEGDSVNELKRYLSNGKVDFSIWSPKVLQELQQQIDDGKCELGLDDNGNALRVASLVKVFIYDEHRDLLLFNPVNSFESHAFLSDTKTINEQQMKLVQNAVNAAQGMQVTQQGHSYYNNAMNHVKRNKSTMRSENVELPNAMVFETTFSPFRETPRDAAARVLAWRFSMKMVTGRIFSKSVPMKEKKYESTHFPGLKSEYQVHHVKINPEFIVPLQKAIPVSTLTPMCLNSATNTGINTHWYCWIRASVRPEQMVDELRHMYSTNAKAQALIGNADFSGGMAQAVGQAMKEEASLLGVWH